MPAQQLSVVVGWYMLMLIFSGLPRLSSVGLPEGVSPHGRCLPYTVIELVVCALLQLICHHELQGFHVATCAKP